MIFATMPHGWLRGTTACPSASTDFTRGAEFRSLSLF
jgi:hypothetical protein